MIRAKRSRKLARAVSLLSKSTVTDSASLLCVGRISIWSPKVLDDDSRSLRSAGRAVRGARGGLDTVLQEQAIVRPLQGDNEQRSRTVEQALSVHVEDVKPDDHEVQVAADERISLALDFR